MGINVSADSALLGIKFINLKDWHIQFSLGIFVIYFLIHFIWIAYESYGEWVIRTTGAKLAFSTSNKAPSVDGDYPDDPKNSTLYNWWSEKSKYLPAEKAKLNDALTNISRLLSDIKDYQVENRTSIDSRINADWMKAVSEISSINSSISQLVMIFESNRITESLRRFDNKYKLLIKSQNLRWIVFDIGLPIILGLISLFMLVFFYPSSLSDCFCKT